MKRNLFCSLAVLLTVQMVAAQQVIEKKDKWALGEAVSGEQTLCVASTENRGFLRTYTLNIQKAKNSLSPVEIFMYENGSNSYGPLATAQINNEILLFNLFSKDKKRQSFWYLPDEVKLLLDTLKNPLVKELVIKPFSKLGGSKVSFSTKGAGQILATMEERCNGKKPLIDERTSALTRQPASFDQNPRVFEANDIASLRSLNAELTFRQDLIFQEESKIAELDKQNKPQLDERAAYLNERQTLANQKIPNLKADIQSTKDRIALGEKRLAQLVTEIPSTKKVRDEALVKRDEAENKIAPHRATHNDLVYRIEAYRTQLNKYEHDLEGNKNSLKMNELNISRFESEARDLNYRIQDLRYSISKVQPEFDRARREYERYDRQGEIQRRLDSDSNYRIALENARRAQVQVDYKRSEVASLERDLGRIQSQLGHCQSVAGNDCTDLKNQVSALEVKIKAARDEMRRLESQYASANYEAKRIEDRITDEVQREVDVLKRNYEVASSKLSQLNAQLSEAEGRRRDIVEYEIPTLQNQNVKLRNAISGLERDIDIIRQNIRTAESNLQNFDRSVDYARLESNLESAQNALDSAQDRYSSVVSEKEHLEQQVPQDKENLPKLVADLQSSETRLGVVSQEIARLNKALVSYDQARGEIESKISGIKEQIKNTQEHYLSFFKS